MQYFDHQHSHQQQIGTNCPLCTGENFSVMLNRALYDRYLANINLYYTDDIHDFMQQEITPQTCKFRQQMCNDNDQELLKREYAATQFPGKIQMLSQYYKFHRDIPKIFEKSVFRILGKHFDKLRHFDYKKIKCVLKEEQGISLTTEKSQESSFYSDEVKKSKYSTVLYELNIDSQSQSQILQNFCQKVDQAYQNVKFKNDFKGQHYSGQKKFEEYLLNMKKANHRTSKIEFTGTSANEKVKNYNLLHKPLSYQHLNHLTLKPERVDSKKKSVKKKGGQIELQNNNALKQSLRNFKKNKIINSKSKSIEKTTANETISRQERSRRMQKLQKTLEFEIEKNQNAIFKPFSTGLIGLKTNAMLKTLDQIYKPVSVHEKYHSDKTAKTSQQQSVNNLQKIYENKLSGRKSSSNLKSKQASHHNSKQIHSHPNKDFLIENQQDTQRFSLKKKQASTTKFSSQKKLSRSKSTAKTLNTQPKTSQKMLQTIDHSTNDKRVRSRSNQKNEIESDHRLSNFMRQKQNVLCSLNKPQKQLKERQSSKKNLNSVKKQRTSSSKKNLNSSDKKLQRNASKSNVSSARGQRIAVDKAKFHTMDPDANKNIEKYLQRKLTIVQKANGPKATKAKFYN